MPEPPPRTPEEIFYECLERSPESRAAYLDEVCRTDAVRREVESLLAAHDKGRQAFPAPSSEGEAATSPGMLPEGEVTGRTIGPYTLVRLLGAGGFGIVYEAEQRDPRRAVALKVMRGGVALDEAAVRLFQREASALARLKHPGIASIYEAGRTDDGAHYFAMELVRGRALMDHVRAHRLSLDTKLDLFGRICGAIQYAHQRGVMHRDLKPGNILIDRDGAPKILDFGLAKITDTDATLTSLVTEVGRVQGTLPYMSPEQARGEADAIDVRSDVYSLGVILYEVLTDELPYTVDRALMHEAVRVICEEPPKRPSTISHVVRGDLETIVLKALAKEPDRRYASASAFSDDLERYRTNQPISARPPSAGYQLRKLVARHKAPFAFAGALAILVVGFGVWMSVLYARAEALRAAADVARDEAQARADDLEEVTRFQTSMLKNLDAERLGHTLREESGAMLRASLEESGRSPAAIDSAVAVLERTWARVNATDVALALIEKQLFVRAQDAVETDFPDRADVRASLRLSLGELAIDLGLNERAFALLDSSLASRTRLYGRNDLRTLRALEQRGKIEYFAGDPDRAEQILREVVKGYRDELGEDHPDVLEANHRLGSAFIALGRYEEAEAIMRDVVEKKLAVFGEDDVRTIEAMEQLGVSLFWQGDTEETRVWYERSLDAYGRVHGEEHIKTLVTMNAYSMLLANVGELEEAEEYARKAFEGSRVSLGGAHSATLTHGNSLGVVYARMGRFEEAEEVFRDVLDGRRRALGPDHPETLGAMNNLGFVIDASGRPSKAMPLYEQALDGFRKSLGDDHTHTQNAISNLARVTFEAGRAREALALLEPAENARRALGEGSNAQLLARFLTYLGRCRAAVGRFEEAREDLEEARSIYESHDAFSGRNAREVLEGFIELYDARAALEPGRGWSAEAAKWREELERLGSS